MASSKTWEDNIIFAMVREPHGSNEYGYLTLEHAPLGILTAVVGAIRVGGPLWLRAIIGRAQENKATAEVQLTTSTSRVVCEMWDGLTTVRIIGSPRILQLIYLPAKKDEPSLGLYTLEEGVKEGIFKLERSRSSQIPSQGPLANRDCFLHIHSRVCAGFESRWEHHVIATDIDYQSADGNHL